VSVAPEDEDDINAEHAADAEAEAAARERAREGDTAFCAAWRGDAGAG
jgi:hypothetical protein